jgi:two-component system NarL family response regulator
MTMTIRVILADDHKILLDTLVMLLEKQRDIQVIGTASNGRAVQDLVAALQPDVVVIDIGMPGMNGIEATRRLVARHPRIKVVALSGFSQKQYVLEMLDAGASGYVLKENAASELVRALLAVMKGQKYLCSEIAAAVVESTGPCRRSGVPQLGAREREVLQLLAEGGTSPNIAKSLFISTSTVDVHRRNIMKKLDLHSVAELTKYAIRNGLTSI